MKSDLAGRLKLGRFFSKDPVRGRDWDLKIFLVLVNEAACNLNPAL